MSILINISEKEYRLIDRDSYSSLACFNNDRRKYYRRYIMKEVGVDNTNKTLIYGSLVDCLLFTPHEYEDRFVHIDFEMPTPQMKTFTEKLAIRVLENNRLDQQRREEVVTLMSWAYNDTKFDDNGVEVAFKRQDFGTTVKKFDSGCDRYLQYLIDTMGSGKMLVDSEMFNRAEEAVKKLRYSTVVGPVINQETESGIDVYDQLIVLYEVLGTPFKSMMDKVIVNHDKKTIQLYDLKTSSSVEEFGSSYLKFSYYIQAGVYYQACVAWKYQMGWGDYVVLPIKFIVIDGSNYLDPLLYTTSAQNLRQSLYGFSVGNKEYRGIIELINDLRWHKENDIWGISKNNYINGGILPLTVYEDRDREEEEI